MGDEFPVPQPERPPAPMKPPSRGAIAAAVGGVAHHLRPGDDPDDLVDTFWKDIDLDLTGTTLIDLDLTACAIRSGNFGWASFSGDVWFDKASFSGDAWFDEATFSGTAGFREATFGGTAWFAETTLPSTRYEVPWTPSPWTSFSGARFEQGVPAEVVGFVSAEGDGQGSEH
ncbi:pentapeptide repeat-containing protein [Actinokineospora sp. 24-640]